MNKNYTLEDVESLRMKAKISYEEAVQLLDKYDGDIARALIELEKRGVIGQKKKMSKDGEGFGDWCKRMWSLGMRTRVHITKGDNTLGNVSVLYMIQMLFAPHILILTLIELLVLGCRVNIIKNSNIYGTADLSDMVSSAAQNIKESVQNLGKVEIKDDQPESQKSDDDDFSSFTVE